MRNTLARGHNKNFIDGMLRLPLVNLGHMTVYQWTLKELLARPVSFEHKGILRLLLYVRYREGTLGLGNTLGHLLVFP